MRTITFAASWGAGQADQAIVLALHLAPGHVPQLENAAQLALLPAAGTLAFLGLAAAGALLARRVLAGGGARPTAEVFAIRADPDFGRIALYGGRLWRGSVELEPGVRPLDLELMVDGDGPTLAHRLALRDARLRWADLTAPEGPLVAALAKAGGAGEVAFLTLRLPSETQCAVQDWAVDGVLARPDGDVGFQVRVRAGAILGVQLEAAAGLRAA